MQLLPVEVHQMGWKSKKQEEAECFSSDYVVVSKLKGFLLCDMIC